MQNMTKAIPSVNRARVNANSEGQNYTVTQSDKSIFHHSDGSMIFRLPTWCIEVHGFCSSGWWGWDDLNHKWIASVYEKPYRHFACLHDALHFCGWDLCLTHRQTIEWTYFHYPSSPEYRLSRYAIMELAQHLDHGDYQDLLEYFPSPWLSNPTQ